MTTTYIETAVHTAVPAIRAATLADRDAIEHLLTNAHLPIDGVQERLAAQPADFFVAIDPDADEVVAVAALQVCCDNALLRSVAVRPDWRALGLGRALVERVVAEAEARGVRALYLLALTGERYFPRLGFRRVDHTGIPSDIAASPPFRNAAPPSAVVLARSLGG
jgi:N-acetylglutamate synthase-like GNAT family acetyltransferase